jgi:crossover junction endonuclease MUS81
MKSGMRHIIYIIEDYAGYDPTDFLEAIQTSISSSQVVNNFFVKRTRNIDETTKYLLRMSKSLSKQHQVPPGTHKLPQILNPLFPKTNQRNPREQC